MTWIFLTIGAAIISSFSNIIDRFILRHETREPNLLSSIWGIVCFIIFASPAIFYQNISWLWPLSLGGIAVGLLYIISMNFYYSSVKEGEISRIIPILTLNPIIVLILATIFFHETHSLNQYLGMGLIIAGIIITSLHDGKDQKTLPLKAIILISLSSLGFAIKNIITKAVTFGQQDYQLNLLFWIGTGIALGSIYFIIKERKSILKTSHKKFLHYFVSTTFSGFSSLLFTLAVTIGEVSMVAFLNRLEILFVFIFAESLDYFNPKFLQEKINRQIFIQKLSSVLIIMLGSYFLI